MMSCWWKRVVLTALVVVGAAINGAHGGATVTGTVFCDQCKDGRVSLFDYPLNGVEVAMLCPGSDSEMEMVGEETTNMFGGYTMRFDGTPDLSSCYTQVKAAGSGSGSDSCRAAAGPAQSLKLTFSFFGMEFYSADALVSQPSQPMSFCQPPATRTPPAASPPPPKLPFMEDSACAHQYWTMPEYRCYWRLVSPDTKVGLVFGPLAAEKYGQDATLWAGLQGRADPYKTLLREAITALLNSYNNPFQFPYTSLAVLQRFNDALVASPRTAIRTAFSFKTANSGSSCKFKACK